MTNLALTFFADGRMRSIPFLNTRQYFEEPICWAIKTGGRLLYLPLRTTASLGFSYSICLYHNETKMFFITRDSDRFLLVHLELRCTRADRTGAYGEIVVSVGGQILGVAFNLHFTHKSGDSCCEDFDVTISKGQASAHKDVILGLQFVPLSEIKTISCDISGNTFDIEITGGIVGTLWSKDLYFDLSE